MNPVMKRYKNQISLISKQMNDLLKNHVYFKDKEGNRRSRRKYYLKIFLKDNLYRAMLRYDILLTNPMIKTVESDGYIFFGIDLNQAVKLKLRTSFGHNEERAVGVSFTDAVLPSWDNPNQPIANEVFNDLVYRGVLDHSMSSDSFTRSNGTKKGISDVETLMQSSYFDDFYREIKSIVPSISINLSLKSGEFPRLSDRSLFPYLWFDPDSGLINYCCDSSAISYRQGRNTASFDRFTSTSDIREAAAYLIDPFSYVIIDLSHRDVDHFRVLT